MLVAAAAAEPHFFMSGRRDGGTKGRRNTGTDGNVKNKMRRSDSPTPSRRDTKAPLKRWKIGKMRGKKGGIEINKQRKMMNSIDNKYGE